MKQTKIVASISDLRCEVDFIRELYEAGVNVVRINTAHATAEGIKKVINNVREVSPHLAILIDTDVENIVNICFIFKGRFALCNKYKGESRFCNVQFWWC